MTKTRDQKYDELCEITKDRWLTRGEMIELFGERIARSVECAIRGQAKAKSPLRYHVERKGEPTVGNCSRIGYKYRVTKNDLGEDHKSPVVSGSARWSDLCYKKGQREEALDEGYFYAASRTNRHIDPHALVISIGMARSLAEANPDIAALIGELDKEVAKYNSLRDNS